MMDMELYKQLTDRNVGVITSGQQKKLKNSCVAIFGVGGLGGVVAEVLCRSGIGHIKIIEHGDYEASNLNRQNFCYRSTLNRNKRDVVGSFLKDINPSIKIELFEKEDPKNIGKILDGVDVAVLCVDKVRACIVISREVRKRNIPLVESWAIPFGNVRVFTKDTMNLEEAYGLSSIGKKVEDISELELKKMDIDMLKKLSGFDGLMKFFGIKAINRIMQGKNPTFAPWVWLNSVLMSQEVVKVILGWGHIALAPDFALYDPFMHRIPIKKKKNRH